MRTVVLDTNVLLSDPDILLSFKETEVVIPETVLSELDKLKTSRADPDLRFRGREVSRALFELSEQGDLIGGIELSGGSMLRVVPLDAEHAFPDGLSSKSADDRILAVALQLASDDVVVVTNDLNMLLKAQTLGVKVQRHFGGVESTFARRFIVRPFQRYKVPIGILAVALAVFAAIIVLSIYNPLTASQQQLPQEFKDQLTSGQRDIFDALLTLQRSPNDANTELKLANIYFDLAENGHINNAVYAQYAVQHYEHILQAQPDNLSVRTDMAAAEFQWLGLTDQAIQDTAYVLRKQPDHLQANYNLGIFYAQGRHDYKGAAEQFEKVIELTKNDSQQQSTYKAAQDQLAQVNKAQSDAAKNANAATSTGGTQ